MSAATNMKEVKKQLIADSTTATSTSAVGLRSVSRNLGRTLLERFWSSWNPELAALSLSTVCAICIAVILRCYDGKPAPKIAMGITLNALISILATTSKAALMFSVSNALGQSKWVWLNGQSTRPLIDAEVFDDASRGPLGAVNMLYTHYYRSFASFGCILIILSLVYDPFMQQVVNYENRVVYAPSALATYPRVRYLAANGANFTATQAVNSAFWQNDFQITPECPSTSCIWPSMTSISWVGQCFEDEHWSLNDECNFILTHDDLQPSHNIWNNQYYNLRNCTATSPEGFQVSTTIEFMMWDDIGCPAHVNGCGGMTMTVPRYTVTSLPSFLDGFPGTSPGYDTDLYNVTEPLFHYTMLHWRPGDGRNFSFQATRCTLELHLDTYNASVSDGQLVTAISQSRPMRKSWQFPYFCFESPDRPAPNFTTFAQELTEDFDSTYHNQLHLIYDPTHTIPGFCVSLNVWWTRLLSNALSVSVNAERQVLKVLWNKTTDVLPSLYDIAELFEPEYLVNTTAVDEAWQELGAVRMTSNLAASLNKLVYNPSLNVFTTTYYGPYYNGTDSVSGQLGVVVNHVKIRWLWLILPYGLSTGAIVFLLYTIYISRRSEAPLWKSSINALIYHGIDHDMDIHSNLASIPEMDQQATTTLARLAPFSERNNRLVLQTTIAR